MKPETGIVLFLCCISFLKLTDAHSWITCTDYLEDNGDYWDQKFCRSFPRHGFRYVPRTGTFGQDTGYDKNGPAENSPCRTARDDSGAYTADHPMAAYYAGQHVVITHPTKNHVADVRCTNKYIPDSSNAIYRGPRNAAADATLSQFRSNKVVDLGVAPVGYQIPDAVTTQYPKPGFQNAPKFCENPDKALATNHFTIPSLLPGRYTFMWAWGFNSAKDWYTSCWEADVYATKSERDQILTGRSLSTQEPVDKATGGKVTAPPTTSTTTTTTTRPPTRRTTRGPGPTPAPTRGPGPTPAPTPTPKTTNPPGPGRTNPPCTCINSASVTSPLMTLSLLLVAVARCMLP